MKKNSSGFSLIEIMVVVALLGGVAMFVTQLLDNLRRETKSIEQKIATVEFSNTLLTLMLNTSICSRVINDQEDALTFNETKLEDKDNPPEIIVDKLFNRTTLGTKEWKKVGDAVSGLARKVQIKSIKIVNISGELDVFTASLRVEFDNTKLLKPIRPIQAPFNFATDPDTPSGSKEIAYCKEAGATSDLTSEIIYEGRKGGGSGVQSGLIEIDSPLSEFKFIAIIGELATGKGGAGEGLAGQAGRSYKLIPVAMLKNKRNHLFEAISYNSGNTASMGVRYATDTNLEWSTIGGGLLDQVWGIR